MICTLLTAGFLFGLSVECVAECRVQLIDHILGGFHVRYDVGNVVWCAITSVPVFANPEIGFVVRVVALVIVKDILQKHIGGVVERIGSERKILSLWCEFGEIEGHV